jgi:hypothetical protein
MKTYLIPSLLFLSLSVPALAIPVPAPDAGGTVGMLSLALVAALMLRRHFRK